MQHDFSLGAYNYELPEENIAQHPADKRDTSRLLTLHRQHDTIGHRAFKDIVDLIPAGDILVVNDTRVFPARLLGKKTTGGKVEVFLLELPSLEKRVAKVSGWKTATATALIKSSKKPRLGSRVLINENLSCTILEQLDGGKAVVELHYKPSLALTEILAKCGQIPLPPYIERRHGTTGEDKKRYQTVYADRPGAVAAPTAGLHFTNSLLEKLQSQGVQLAKITLHVGYGTFSPVRTEHIEDHVIHEEYVHIPRDSAEKINSVRKQGGKVWAVGTTTVRALEYSADGEGRVQPTRSWCDLYIVPGYRFKVIDNLITNFHLPQSSLLFLVSALCGRKTLLNCYEEAIKKGYRFYSYGDAMAILK